MTGAGARRPRVYLAGPEVFHPQAAALGRAKAALAAEFGLEGLFPLDEAVCGDGLTPGQHGLAIYRADIAMMDRCDAIVANLTPFRGPHADPGTAFELGYMRAQGKPCLAYSAAPGALADRVAPGADDPTRDAEGYAIEDFAMADNLMLAGAVFDADGGAIEAPPSASGDDPFWDFRALRASLARAAAILADRPRGP
ncbi:MAG: nucleoside 2-deoxyribosyltransferase [Alphaproteobacteria bacterium]|nr:nucleoside 2-deoxyribosyltransferase [Alphaproteobacteria bacterium]